MKDDKGIVMELDDVKGSMDPCDNQKADLKIKLDNPGENSDLHTLEGTLVDGMDIDAIDANSEDQVCADHENGLKPNNAMLIENQDSEPIVYTDSGKATTTADENPESVEGGTDVLSLESTKQVLVTCDATFTSTSFNSSDPGPYLLLDHSSASGEFVEPVSGESKDLNVQVVSMDNASANEDETSRLYDVGTDASLGIESEDKNEKPNMGLPILETDIPDASIASSIIADTHAAPVPGQGTNEESEGHVAHQQPSLTNETLVRCVNPGPECEADVTLDKCFDKNVIDGAAQVDTNVKDQEMLDQDANADVSIADSMIADSDTGLRNDTNMHEQPPFPDESLKCVNQQLECELDTSVGECLDKNTTNGLAQGGSKVEDIPEMQRQTANAEQLVSMDAASARDKNVTELHNPVTPVIVDKQVMHVEPQMDEKLDTSTLIQKTEVFDVLVDVSDVMNSNTAPKQDVNEECEGCGANEQPLLLDESLVRGSDQEDKCEPDTSVGECLVKNATDGVTLDGINMEGNQEMQEAAVSIQQIELPIKQLVNENPDSDSVKPQSKDEKHARHESTPTQQVELPETAVPTPQVELPEEQEADEDPVSDSPKPQSKDEKDARRESTPTQQAESPETAVPTQQVELPEEQEADEDPVSDSAKPQNKDEKDVRCGSTSTQPVESPEAAVSTQQVGLSEEQEVDEDPVSDSAKPQSKDEKDVGCGSTSTQPVEYPEAAVSTQRVELFKEQEVNEDPVSDSAKPQSKDEKDVGCGSTSTQLVDSPEAAVYTQQVELPEEHEVDEDPVSDSAKPQSMDEKDVGCGSTSTQPVESPEAAASTQQVELPEEQEVDEDPVSDSAKPRMKDEKNGRRGSAKPGSFISNHRVTYQLPPEDEGEFSVFDLVWGKVKSHPWWPGQIFHPSDSSEKAMKYYKKDCYLVAYFGDRSFAWNDASVLKPFRKHFSLEEKQSSTESFLNAVNCALAEVSRRVELGLACSCISEAAYEKIRYQIVENGGIREESSKREGIDRSTGPDTFHSDKLVEYVRALATSPTSGADRLDVSIAKAQLLAFNRLKGCDALAEFQYYDGLAEFDANSLLSVEKGILGDRELGDSAGGDDGKTRLKGPRKRKHNLKDIVYQRRKEKSLTELMGETMYYLDGEFDSLEEDDIGLTSPTSGSKRKASGYLAGDFPTQPGTKTISFAKVSHTASSNLQQSFKVGECIRRVASQLTGSPSIIKCASDGSDSKVIGDDVDEVIDAPEESVTESTMIPQKQSSPEEMISQLHLSARDPMKGYSFLGDIISFFYEFRNVAVSAQRQKMRKGPGRKRKPSVPAVGSPAAFEFDDRNDSYWTDMVVQNNSDAKPARRGRKRKEDKIVTGDSEKPLQSKRKYTRKQYFHSNHEPPVAEIPSRDEKQDQLPTELMLNFGDVGSIPSEVNLNKMFRRFGPLKESETGIDAQSSRARVVFKKRSDAEVAYSSATMFNVFGSTLVNYQLNYTPSVPFGTSPLALSNPVVEHAT